LTPRSSRVPFTSKLGELRVGDSTTLAASRMKDAFGNIFTKKKSSDRRWAMRTG